MPASDSLNATKVVIPMWKLHIEVEDLIVTQFRVVLTVVLGAGLQPARVDRDREGICSGDGGTVCSEDVVDNHLHDSCKAYEDNGS